MNKAHDIIEIVNNYFETDVLANIKNRKKEHLYPRQMAQYFLFMELKNKAQVGRFFSVKHDTIYHNIKCIESDISVNKTVKNDHDNIKIFINDNFLFFSENALIHKGFIFSHQYNNANKKTKVYAKNHLVIGIDFEDGKLQSWDVSLPNIPKLKMPFSELLQLDAILNK